MEAQSVSETNRCHQAEGLCEALIQRFDWKAVLHDNNRVLPPSDTPPRLLFARFQQMTGTFMSKLAAVLSEQLQQQIELCYQRLLYGEARHSAQKQMLEENSVVISLRVFHENLYLVLPVELVHEIGAFVMKDIASSILSAPTNEEITAVSFLVARILAEESLLAKQRIYLSSVRRENSTRESNAEDLARTECGIEVLLLLNDCEYPVLVLLHQGVCRRLESYAKLVLQSTRVSKLLRHVRASWSLRLQLQVTSLAFLTELKPGFRFVIPTSQGVLSERNGEGNEHRDNCTSAISLTQELGTARRKSERGGLAVELLSGSVPGLVRLRIQGS